MSCESYSDHGKLHGSVNTPKAAFVDQMHVGLHRKDRTLLLVHETDQVISCNILNWRLTLIA